jgi:hypothetical protein
MVKARTTCLDLRPDVVFTITDQGMFGQPNRFVGSSSVVEPETEWQEAFQISGTIVTRSCDQVLMAMSISKPVQIDAGAQVHIQLRIPKQLALSGNAQRMILDFEDFERLRMVASFSDASLLSITSP